jgi:fumarate hydratase class II
LHVAAALEITGRLLPALRMMHAELAAKSAAWSAIIKIGRTHLQDATPLTLGQEVSGYAAQVEAGIARIETALAGIYPLAQGGTAVGTGLNAPAGFGAAVAAELAAMTGLPFVSAPNKFAQLGGQDALLFLHGALTSLTTSLYKIASDIRLLGSGPRAGLGELALPENEPGSSIMPGKVNPTQVEAMTQVCAQVFGNQATLTFANSQGQLELNVYRPVMALAFLQSVRLLGDAAQSFTDHLLKGLEPRQANIARGVENSLMLVTALAPSIGYDAAATIAKTAHHDGLTLRDAAIASGLLDGDTFDRIVDPRKMLGPATG